MDEMIKKLKELIAQREAKQAELAQKSAASQDIAELRAINQEMKLTSDNIAELRAMLKEHEAAAAKAEEQRKAAENEKPAIAERTAAVQASENENAAAENRGAASLTFAPGKGFAPAESRAASVDYMTAIEEREKAGAELKEKRAVNSSLGLFGELRSVAVGDGTSIAVPHYYGNAINPDFSTVSSLIDGVERLTLPGGESFRQPYVKGIGEGGYTAEGAAAAVADTEFGYADINKTKITAYSEITEELLKLPNAPYADEVFRNVRTSLRAKISKEILVGTGGTSQLVGIFTENAAAIDAATDLELSAIDDTTLDEILFRYGGHEDVEGAAVLILNKLDLLAFAKVRTSTREKFYTIITNGNTGTINGVPFIINSACKQLTATATVSTVSAPAYCMAYGHLQNYKLVEFSPVEIKRSEDYKFKEGMIAHRGAAMMGGNVVRHNGFLRVKKAIVL